MSITTDNIDSNWNLISNVQKVITTDFHLNRLPFAFNINNFEIVIIFNLMKFLFDDFQLDQLHKTNVTLVCILLFRASLSAEHSHYNNRQGRRTLRIKFQTMNKFTQSNWTRESTNMLQSLFAARFLIISLATRLRRFSLACQVTPRSDDNEIAPPTSCKFGILQLTF